MLRLRFLVIPLLVAIFSAGCSQNPSAADAANPPVPRPKAFPRPVLCDTVYVAPDSLPCGISVNAATILSTDRRSKSNIWLNATYPAYGATLRFTLTRTHSEQELQEVIDNRTQRMALNLGDNPAQQTDLTTRHGVSALILTAATPSVTPIQFIATAKPWVISGVLEMPQAAAAPTDSLRPVIEAIGRDLIHTFRNLHANESR